MKKNKTPPAGDKADASPAPQPADPLLLPDDTPDMEGHRPDGTTWRKMTADVPANYVPVEQLPAATLGRIRRRYGKSLDDRINRHLDKLELRDALPVSPAAPSPPGAPSVLLATWREILIALGMKNTPEDRDKVSRLSKSYDGPIRFPGQGKQPLVDKAKLIEWWNRLEIQLQDLVNQARGGKTDAESGHDYGRTGKAVPSIGGGVKQRRRDRKP